MFDTKQEKSAAVEGSFRNEELGTFSTTFKASEKVSIILSIMLLPALKSLEAPVYGFSLLLTCLW